MDTLERAIPKLIKNLQAGKFDPERSSLTTYFIGQCAIVFRDVATSWQTRWHREQFELAAFDWDGVFGGLPTADDLDHRLDLRAEVAKILGGLMPTQRIVLVRCLLEGLSYAETGDLLHITARAVDGHLRRARKEAHHLVNLEYIRHLLDLDPDSYDDERAAA